MASEFYAGLGILLDSGKSWSPFELELTQSQRAQKPLLRGEVGARAWRVCGQARGGVWDERRSSRRLNELACVVKPIRRVCRDAQCFNEGTTSEIKV